MRANLVFPPAICLPNQIYYSLPILAGALRRGGHQPRCVDLNLVAADLLLSDRVTADFLELAGRMAGAAAADGDHRRADEIRRHADANEPVVRQGEACKRALRDPARFYHQPTFRWAFWTIVDALAGFYALDPVISPFRETFARDLLDHQQRDPWTAVAELYDRGLLEAALAGDPEFIGISVAFPEQAAESVRLARRIRQRAPGVHICFGGPLITAFADRWLEQDWLLQFCDTICIGDGETAIVELCDALAGRSGLDQVRNLVWRDAGGRVHRPAVRYLEDMDDLPSPDFAACDMARYFLPEPIYPLMLSRGCYWGKCTFCSIGWRENYRMSSAAKIRADAEHVARGCGGRFVQLQDSSAPPKAARHLASAIREANLELYWVTGMKFERCFLDRDYCQHIGGAGGCRSLLMGFESSDQRLLDLMQKGFQFAEVPAMLDNLRAAGVSAELLWFIGFPTQTRRDVLDTALWLYRNRTQFGLTAFVGDYYLHPDTEVFQRPQDFGVVITGQDNGRCLYRVQDGIGVEEAATLKRMLADNNNRTLTCNGSHLPHLAVSGPDLRGLERAMVVPDAVVQYCSQQG